jgi:16S rRNA (uracil1498-N3)-methyltransferase
VFTFVYQTFSFFYAMTQSKPKIRLYVPAPYAAGESVTLDEAQSHYLARVMRCRKGDVIGVFNGHDGEFLAEIEQLDKKHVTLLLKCQRVPQLTVPDLWLAFAPVKSKTELVVEKAVELGVSKLLPVFTRHAVVKSINREKLEAHAREAAEQCERCDIPEIEEHKDLAALLGNWPKDRTLLYGDESGGGIPIKRLLETLPQGKYALLVGPEGGFAAEEHQILKIVPFVKAFTMGPRILKGDTAAVAALACVQSWLGDWDIKPKFES